jgi:hypothetical protein
MPYKKWLQNFWFSFPIQLLLLHFKKHQLVLIYWVLLFATVGGGFMKMFGANSLFLAPEYLDTVSGFAAAMVGASIGVFIMSWNITTFILYSKHIKFLATTSRPFVKYCLNNFILPLLFLVFYLFKAIDFGIHKELFDWAKIIELTLGFLVGLVVNVGISFFYFFSADKNITKKIDPVLRMHYEVKHDNFDNAQATTPSNLIKVKTYLVGIRKTAVVRDVKHYNKQFIETVFSRHHLSSVILIILAFFFLIGISFLDNNSFQIPAAASITLFFTILLSLFGALAYFLQNWSLPFTIGVFLLLNYLYTQQIIDPTNKAYGLRYDNKKERPNYDAATVPSLCTPDKMMRDKQQMLTILNNWKKQQREDKPILYLVNVSGGGTRSATFAMHVLQKLDSITKGDLFRKTFLITGASGGMLGAAYFRELYLQKKQGKINSLQNPEFVNNVGKDLLNPIFSSLVARDILSPAQKFDWVGQSYLKDRAYAFEEKLNDNTDGLLNKSIGDCRVEEASGNIPLMILSSVILRDGRKMLVSTQPISYLMKPFTDSFASTATVDAIDFNALFAKQQPQNLRLLTALRMNATFPYVLPTVWLPTNPVIDVMDAGIRDNYGQEIATRFISVFADWLKANTSKVVIVGIRDRPTGNWDHPFESNSMIGSFIKPVTQLQYNIFKIQDYIQNEQYSYLQKIYGNAFQKVVFEYFPVNEENHAALSFHLTNREKNLIKTDMNNVRNQEAFERIRKLEAN